MHELYELKEMLCEELKECGKKKELTSQSIDLADKLARTMKNIDKIIESYEENGVSMDGGSYHDGGSYRGGRSGRGSYRGSYEGSFDGMGRSERSYARGRGSNVQRDSMGRYADGSSYGDSSMVEGLRDMMNETQDERKRMEIQKLISKIESM